MLRVCRITSTSSHNEGISPHGPTGKIPTISKEQQSTRRKNRRRVSTSKVLQGRMLPLVWRTESLFLTIGGAWVIISGCITVSRVNLARLVVGVLLNHPWASKQRLMNLLGGPSLFFQDTAGATSHCLGFGKASIKPLSLACQGKPDLIWAK